MTLTFPKLTRQVFTPSYINFDSLTDKITLLASETSVLKYKKLH